MAGHHHLPQPPRQIWPAVAATLTLIAGLAVLALALSGGGGAAAPPPTPPQPVIVRVPATVPAPTPAEQRKAERATRSRAAGNRPAATPAGRPALTLESGWVESFYPIYAEAQRVYRVNWLLIASVHRQETAFSTNPTTYFGLNFAGCCGGPMQFNVRNGDSKGRGSTWDRYKDSHRAGNRPARYLSMRKRHPSLYDDFDAIMAGAHLLSDNGAGLQLDASAWGSAYLYYGRDLNGVDYASQVTARAIGWARNGFCAACADSPALTARVDAAWAGGERARLLAADQAAERARREAQRERSRR